MNQHHESISLTAGVLFIHQKIMDQLWSVWDEMLKIPEIIRLVTNEQSSELIFMHYGNLNYFMVVVPVDGIYGQDSISTHVAVTVLQAGPDSWHERLKQLRLFQLAQKTQSGATDELIGMLQVLKLTFQPTNTKLIFKYTKNKVPTILTF